MNRAVPRIPVWVYRYHPKAPMPGWLRWNPFVVWQENKDGGLIDLSVMLPNGMYLHAKAGDFLVRGPIGEVSLLTPRMYHTYYKHAQDDATDEPPALALSVHGPLNWQAAAAEGIASA